MVRLEPHVDGERLEARRTDLNVMRAWSQVQVLEVPVEVIDNPGVIPVDKHLRLLGFDLQPQPASRTV